MVIIHLRVNQTLWYIFLGRLLFLPELPMDFHCTYESRADEAAAHFAQPISCAYTTFY